MNIDQTISDLSVLPVEHRLRIVQELWDSIPADVEMAVSAEQAEELNRRIAAHDADPDSAISQHELKRRLRDND